MAPREAETSVINARELFGSVIGDSVLEYKCKYLLQSGAFFVGNLSVGFCSKTFGKFRRIVVPWSDVASVTTGKSHELCISTVGGDEYVFRKFDDRDSVLKHIKDARREALTHMGEERTEEPPERLLEDEILRTHSDSILMKPKHHKNAYELEGDTFFEALTSMRDLSDSIRQVRSIEADEEDNKAHGRVPRPIPGAQRDDRTKSTRFLSFAGKTKSAEDMKKDWEKLKSGKDPVIKEVALDKVEIACPFSQFHETFWSGTALHPIEVYQRDVVGDTEIETSEWEAAPDGFTMERTIKYLHPSTAPMGPPKARTEKEQQLQRYGSHGLLIHTVTKVDDVPMADCFVLEDRIIVEPCNGGDSVLLSAHIGIRFVKSTMWKRVIESNSKKGITSWLTGYSEYLSKKMA